MTDCSNLNDSEVVWLISARDLDAFYCIVSKYEEKLLRYILRITNIDIEEAENLLQEVFIKVYKNINDYNKSLQFSSWIYRIAHNTSIDYYRKNKNKQSVSLETDDNDYVNLIEMLESWDDVVKDLEEKELSKKIRDVLNMLDLKYKEILVLKFLEERSYDEISDILKIPPWTVATLISRGKKQFLLKAKENNLNLYM